MSWTILQETKRSFADESYFLKAERDCLEGKLVLEIEWAQIMYAITVDLFRENSEAELIYDCMLFYEDRIEKYGHQIMRMTTVSPLEVFRRLSQSQQDGVLNYVLSEKYNVTYETTLPKKTNA